MVGRAAGGARRLRSAFTLPGPGGARWSLPPRRAACCGLLEEGVDIAETMKRIGAATGPADLFRLHLSNTTWFLCADEFRLVPRRLRGWFGEALPHPVLG
jgi:hypothetical protein